jgi:hypothetical protein
VQVVGTLYLMDGSSDSSSGVWQWCWKEEGAPQDDVLCSARSAVQVRNHDLLVCYAQFCHVAFVNALDFPPSTCAVVQPSGKHPALMTYRLLCTCRGVCDGTGASAAIEKALQRTLMLLVVQHLALLDQQQHPQKGSSSSSSSNRAGDLSSPSSGSRSPAAAAAVGQKVQMRIDSACAASCSSESSWLQQVLADIGCSTAQLPVDSSNNSSTGTATADSWQQLQQLPDAAFADKLRSSQLPLVLPGRMLAQLSLVAGMGRDPVNSLEGLHVAAVQTELLQLLQQQAAAAAAVEPNTAAAAAAGLAGASPDVVGRGVMAAADISCALRLLHCSSFVSAAHKLMWWMHGCIDQPTNEVTNANDAAAPAAAAPVAVLSGTWSPAVNALAATAAAALGATVLRLELLQPGRAEHRLAEAVQAAAAAAAAASSAAVTAETELSVHSPVEDNSTEQQFTQLPDHLAADTNAAPAAAAAAAAAAAPPALVVAVLDLQHYGTTGNLPTGQKEELLQLLRRWSSQPPCSVSLNTALEQQQQQDEIACAAVAPCVCFVVLCAPHTAQQLLQGMPALQSHCYQLSLPAVQDAEQLAADCKAQIMSSCGWALLEHIRDVHTLAHHQQQQQQMRLGSGSSSSSSRETSEEQGQPSSSSVSGAAAAAPAAVAAEPTARHLAERLAAALASIHSAVHAAYADYYLLDTTCSSSSSSNGEAGSRCNDHSRVPFSAVANFKQAAAFKASQSVNIAKPFDVLQLLPALLSEGRGQLVARRASLTTCIAKTAKVQQQVQELLQRRKQQQQQQQTGTSGASAAAAAPAPAAAGSRFAAAAEIEVLSNLGHQLQLPVNKWRNELEQQVSTDPIPVHRPICITCLSSFGAGIQCLKCAASHIPPILIS